MPTRQNDITRSISLTRKNVVTIRCPYNAHSREQNSQRTTINRKSRNTMRRRPNPIKKDARIEHLRLNLKRRCRYNLLAYVNAGTYDMKAIIAQRKIKQEIVWLEQQRYGDEARVGYRENYFSETCDKFLYSTWLNEREFRRTFSMDRPHFWKLHGLIKDHDIFKRGTRAPPQAKSEYQLMVLLAYMRTEGNGMCNESARNLFLTGSGTVEKMRQRVVLAIQEKLLDATVFWPDKKERKVISQAFLDDFEIPNVTAILDSTLLGIAFTPRREDAGDFKGRKGHYTLTCLIANDHKKRIRYYHLGWPGSTHDDRVLLNSWLAQNSQLAFGTTGIALGDCAYAPRDWVIPAFKKPVGVGMPSAKAGFNTLLAKPRVTSEHTIGILKGHYPFLRPLRFQLTEDKETMAKIQQYVAVAIILHNLLIGWDDTEWEQQEGDTRSITTDLDEDNELNQPVADGSTTDTRRKQLYSYFLEALYS